MSEIDEIISEISPHYKGKKDAPLDFHLVYDSSTETLEPVYFWLLDFAQKGSYKVEKLVDNFASSPGGGHFSEIGMKKTQMQQEASRVLATINSVLKSVINLIYDLKEFKMRLSHYEAAESKEKSKSEAGMLALKQIWMDKVDIQRGAGSLNAMSSGNLQFVTLRDAFMIVKSVEDVDKLDLNDRVKRVLKPRVQEFFEWIKRSYAELKKRFEIEKTYLKSQVDSLKLQSRWAKPYLKAAEQLAGDDKMSNRAELVTVFNTVMIEIDLMGAKKYDVSEAIDNKNLPWEFKKILKKVRDYYQVIFIDFVFTGIPNKVGQHYAFGGKASVKFRAYSLNEDEVFMLKKKLDDSNLTYSLKLIEGMTEDSISQLQIDIDELIGENEKKKEKEKAKQDFASFFGLTGKKKESDEDKLERLKKGIKKDSYPEEYIRNMAEAEAKNFLFNIYDKYKKGHGMASIPYDFDYQGGAPTSAIESWFGFGGYSSHPDHY